MVLYLHDYCNMFDRVDNMMNADSWLQAVEVEDDSVDDSLKCVHGFYYCCCC